MHVAPAELVISEIRSIKTGAEGLQFKLNALVENDDAALHVVSKLNDTRVFMLRLEHKLSKHGFALKPGDLTMGAPVIGPPLLSVLEQKQLATAKKQKLLLAGFVVALVLLLAGSKWYRKRGEIVIDLPDMSKYESRSAEEKTPFAERRGGCRKQDILSTPTQYAHTQEQPKFSHKIISNRAVRAPVRKPAVPWSSDAADLACK